MTKEQLIEKIATLEIRMNELQKTNSYLNSKLRQYEDHLLDESDEYTRFQTQYDRFF